MEKFTIENDMKLISIKAEAFPEGIGEAFKKLHNVAPVNEKRRYFGLSRPENGTINYWAAAEELTPGEAEKSGYEIKVIKSGDYIGRLIPDFMDDIPAIGKTFQELIKHSDIDPEGYCVECYINDKDVRCMVRLTDEK